jgi:DNA gyrase/topoisomerase IV subunit B
VLSTPNQRWREGVLWEQRFCQGIALEVPSIVEYENKCSTRIETTPDREIFKGAKLRSSMIRWHLFETAYLASKPNTLGMLGFEAQPNLRNLFNPHS